MNVLPGFSAATYDLLTYSTDNPLVDFWKTIQIAMQKGHTYPRSYEPLKPPALLEKNGHSNST